MRTIHPIAAYRSLHKMTLSAFGELAGVQKAAVHKWENETGKPSIDAARRIDERTNGALPKWLLRPDVWAVDDSLPRAHNEPSRQEPAQ